MSKILAFLRKEAVVFAGVATSILTFLVANDNVIAGIIPVALSLITRTQVSPVAKLEELLRLIAQLQGKLKARPVK